MIYDDLLPTALALGVPYETFWHLNPRKLMSYTKAEEIRAKMRDRDAWRFGMYNYIALARVAPILQAFAKKGTKAGDYPERPLYMEQEEKQKETVRPADMTEEEYLNTPEMVKKAEMVLNHLVLLQRTQQIDKLNKRYESMNSDHKDE